MEKFCTNCWFVNKFDPNGFLRPQSLWTCTHEGKVSLITGLYEERFCSNERFKSGSCGENGKNYQDAKERRLEENRAQQDYSKEDYDEETD